MHFLHTFRDAYTPIGGSVNACVFRYFKKKTTIKCTRAAWLPPRGTGGTNPSLEEHTPRTHRGGRMPGRASRAASRGKPRTVSGLGRLPRCCSAPEGAASQRPRGSAARREPRAGWTWRRGCVPSDAASCGPAATRVRAAGGGGAPPPTARRTPAPRPRAAPARPRPARASPSSWRACAPGPLGRFQCVALGSRARDHVGRRSAFPLGQDAREHRARGVRPCRLPLKHCICLGNGRCLCSRTCCCHDFCPTARTAAST